MRFPFQNLFKTKSEPLSPEDIASKAEEQSKRIEAEIDARAVLEKARRKREKRSMSGWLVTITGVVFILAALAIVSAGYWYDFLFYGSQSDNIGIIVGLIAFAGVARTCAVFLPVALDATKPDQDKDDKSGFLKFVQLAPEHRAFIKVLLVGAICVCSIPTLSFFVSGHDSDTQNQASQVQDIDAFKARKKARIDAIYKGLDTSKETRDFAVNEAQKSIDAVKDENPGVSIADNETIRSATQTKQAAIDAYTVILSEKQSTIEAIEAEVFVGSDGEVIAHPTAAPFKAVYRYLSQLVGTEEIWAAIMGGFFAVMFELFCAGLTFLSFILIKVLPRAAQAIEMRHASDHVEAQLKLDRMQADIELGALRLKDELEQERLRAEIEATRLKIQQETERANASIELARREREVEKANQQAEALRNGKPWIDPDNMVEAESARQRAIQQARIRELTEISEKLQSGELNANDLDEDGELKLTAEERRQRKAKAAKEFYKDAVNSNKIPLPETYEEDAA